MTTPGPHDPRQASQTHLEIVEQVIETIQETYPAAATLDCHQQMRDILTRIKNTLDHPILFAAHIIVYLVKAVRFSRRWATLVKNIPTLPAFPSSQPLPPSDPSDPSYSSSILSTQHSVPSSESSPLTTQNSLLNPQSAICNPQSPTLTPQRSALRTQHSLQTRLRIRAFALALQHERHIAQKLPPSVPKPDLTPILTSRRHRSPIFDPQSPAKPSQIIRNTQSSLFSPHSSALSTQHSALSSQPPLFPSEAFWTSKVQSLQLKILANITRALDYISVAYLAQYDFPISSIPSIPPIPSTPSCPSHSSHPSHPSHSSHSSPPQPPALQLQGSRLKTPDSRLTPLSHPPPQHP